MQELIAYNKWLIDNNERFFQEYLNSLPKNAEIFKTKLDLNLQDIINYVYDLYEIPLQLRNIVLENRMRESNELSNAKSMVVNYILNNNIKLYDYKTIYDKLFGYKTNRTTSLKAKSKKFEIEEPIKWEKFTNYINNNTINWNPIITKDKFFDIIAKFYKINIDNLFIKNTTTKMNLESTIRGLIIKYLTTNNILNLVQINNLFEVSFSRANLNFWKNKKLNKKNTIIYDFIISIMDNYTIIWT